MVRPIAGSRVARVSHPFGRTSARPAPRTSPWPVQIRLAHVEAVLMVLCAALALVYAGTVVGRAVLRPRVVPTLTVRVQPGDTLWTYASRYGSPDEYILRRIDRLAAINHLPAGAHLRPGQVLRIPVENPAALTEQTASAR